MQRAAEELGLPVWQPDTINSEAACNELRSLQPDLLVVCDYGEILKPAVLSVASLGGINLHGSLLPKYRGAAPVQWAVLNGDAETGNTVIQMTPGLDAGPCLGVDRVPIDADESAGDLERRLAERGGELVLQTIDALAAGTAKPIKQDRSEASKAPRLEKEHGLIDWSRPASRGAAGATGGGCPGPSGLAAGDHKQRRGMHATPVAAPGPVGRLRLRRNPQARSSLCRFLGRHQPSRLAAAEVPRRRASAVGRS